MQISATFSGKVVAILPPRDYSFMDDSSPPKLVEGTTRDIFIVQDIGVEPIKVRFPDDQAMNYVRVESAGFLAEVQILGVVRGVGNAQHLSCVSLVACESAKGTAPVRAAAGA